MRQPTLCFCLLICLLLTNLSSRADSLNKGLSSHFQWKQPPLQVKELIQASDPFVLEGAHLSVMGPPSMQEQGKRLFAFLQQAEKTVFSLYQLEPGILHPLVYIVDREIVTDKETRFRLSSGKKNQLIFPFPMVKEGSNDQLFPSVALFKLLQAIIKADLAYGSVQRMPVSSHAFRFVDGLSGFLAADVLFRQFAFDQDRLFNTLQKEFVNSEETRLVSSRQLLSQNASSEESGLFAGLDQFFSGVVLRRDSDLATIPLDSSSLADRIAVFLFIHQQQGDQGIKTIIKHLSKNATLWNIEENRDDSFCLKLTGKDCKQKTIDGTRSDIIIKLSSGKTFAEHLQQVKAGPPLGSVSTENQLGYAEYNFDFPKAGGANQASLEIELQHHQVGINAGDILDPQTIPIYGLKMSAGFKDEAFQFKLDVSYASGTQSLSEQFTYSNKTYEVPQMTTFTDLQIGTRLLERGLFTGWVRELGVYFHWKRLQIEWDLSEKAVLNKNLEYLNRGYFLLDIQNFQALKFAQKFDLGLNYDFQVGLVNQSGSTQFARAEKYNKDVANLVFGARLGPELRLQIPAIHLNFTAGVNAHYLWQPLDDRGGQTGGDNTLNASQVLASVYATLAVFF